MIDPGATHNSISLPFITKNHLPVQPTAEFGATLGTGGTVRGSGECKAVVLNLGALEITEDFFPLDLGTSDVILGIQWLEKLGTVSTKVILGVILYWNVLRCR